MGIGWPVFYAFGLLSYVSLYTPATLLYKVLTFCKHSRPAFQSLPGISPNSIKGKLP